MKKLLAIVVAILMTACFIAGCAGGDLGSEGAVKVGYAIWSGEAEDALAYGDSIKVAAEAAGYTPVYFDNKADGQITVDNVKNMAAQGITYVINGKPDTSTDEAIAQLIEENGLKFVTLDLPQTGGVFCGVDNKKACIPGGEALMKAAQEKWNGEFDAFIKVWNPAEGEIVADRMSSFVEGAKSVADIPDDKLMDVETEPTSQAAMEKFSAFLTANPTLTKMLVVAENDGTAQGVIAAAQNANRIDDVLVCGAGCDSLAISMMLQDTEGFVGSVNFGFFDTYGEVAVKMIQEWIETDKAPETTYVDTRFTSKDTLEEDVPQEELDRLKGELGIQ